MKIAVIGAGIIGISTAYELVSDGHEVTVFERNGAAAEEASFASAGVLSASLAAPWANPGMLRKLFKYSLSTYAPSKLGMPLSVRDLACLLRSMPFSKQSPYLSNKAQLYKLAVYSRARLLDVVTAHNIEFDQSEGVLMLLRNEREAKSVQAMLDALQELGSSFTSLDATQARTVEPALNPDTPLFGAIHFPQDRAGNSRQYALLLKNLCQSLGVKFHFSTPVYQLQTITEGVELALESHSTSLLPMPRFDGVVLCAGLASAKLVPSLRLPLAPVYGYAISAGVREPVNSPRSAVVDARFQMAMSRLGNRVRVSGASLLGGGPELKKTESGLRTTYKVLQDWFPGAARLSSGIQEWRGARPTLPDGLPIVGPADKPKLWLNLGHGANGWTLASGSARAVADMVAGIAPEVDLNPFDYRRFR